MPKKHIEKFEKSRTDIFKKPWYVSLDNVTLPHIPKYIDTIEHGWFDRILRSLFFILCLCTPVLGWCYLVTSIGVVKKGQLLCVTDLTNHTRVSTKTGWYFLSGIYPWESINTPNTTLKTTTETHHFGDLFIYKVPNNNDMVLSNGSVINILQAGIHLIQGTSMPVTEKVIHLSKDKACLLDNGVFYCNPTAANAVLACGQEILIISEAGYYPMQGYRFLTMMPSQTTMLQLHPKLETSIDGVLYKASIQVQTIITDPCKLISTLNLANGNHTDWQAVEAQIEEGMKVSFLAYLAKSHVQIRQDSGSNNASLSNAEVPQVQFDYREIDHGLAVFGLKRYERSMPNVQLSLHDDTANQAFASAMAASRTEVTVAKNKAEATKIAAEAKASAEALKTHWLSERLQSLMDRGFTPHEASEFVTRRAFATGSSNTVLLEGNSSRLSLPMSV